MKISHLKYPFRISIFSFRFALAFLFLTLLQTSSASFAGIMNGKVVAYVSDAALAEVSITNVHTGKEVITTGTGMFEMEVKKGDLIEFRRAGYELARVRVKSDLLARYYYIQLQLTPTTIENQLMRDYFTDAKIDSIKRRELYEQALGHYKLTGLDIIQHPFDAMSKKNRMIWAFQKNYEIWEKDKFVDYVFNDRLIVQLTGLDGESIELYKKMYRPPYDLIRGMKEYEYYTYIKETVKEFKIREERYKNQNDNPIENYNFDR